MGKPTELGKHRKLVDLIWDVIEIFFPYLVNIADFNNNNNNNTDLQLYYYYILC